MDKIIRNCRDHRCRTKVEGLCTGERVVRALKGGKIEKIELLPLPKKKIGNM